MAKVRVYELAKELGVESKTLLNHLKEQGEFVRSASSTIEPPVVRKIRETFPAELAVLPAVRLQTSRARRKTCRQEVGSQARRCRRRSPRLPVAPAVVAVRSLLAGSRCRPCGSRFGSGASSHLLPGGSAPPARWAYLRAPLVRCADAPKGAARRGAPPAAPAAPPQGVALTPGAPAPRPGAPRPGNNPFAPSQGMPRGGREGREPREVREPGVGRDAPPAARPGNNPFAPSQGMPRPQGGRPAPAGAGGPRPGAPRPNPGMMPDRAAVGRPGERPARGGAPGRPVAWWRRRFRRSSRRWWRRRFRRSSRWWRRSSRWARWPWWHPGRLRPWWWTSGSRSQVQARQASGVRADAGPVARRCHGSPRRRQDRHPGASWCLADRLRRQDQRQPGEPGHGAHPPG